MRAIIQICDAEPFLDIDLEQKFADETIYATIRDVALDLDQTINSCKWNNKNNNCASIFQSTITEDGLCFTFNNLSPEDIYTEKYEN